MKKKISFIFGTRPEAIMQNSQQFVLITRHRRENFGTGFQNICKAIKSLAQKFPEAQFVYTVHLNPNVRKPVHSLLGNEKNISI